MTTFSDVETVARTLWAEARGEGRHGMYAVACVIRNRVRHPRIRWWGTGWEGVCRKPWQFSCWNKNDPNYPVLVSRDGPDDRTALVARELAALFVFPAEGQEPKDITGGSDAYHAVGLKPPHWTKGCIPQQIGRHLFYRVNP